MSKEKEDAWIPRSGPMPRPESVEQAEDVLQEEAFQAPEHCDEVEFRTNEFTSVCPRTGQPDFSTVIINYNPDKLALESKSVKFYLWSFRQYGGFCETLAQKIAEDIMNAIEPHRVTVTIEQNIRGGLELDSTTELKKEEYFNEE